MTIAVKSNRVTQFLVVCCVIQIAACIYYYASFARNGYLPTPFVYDKSDTFMDFFNPMFWADDSGRYTVWKSIYPPINFWLLKAARWLLFGQTSEADGFALRDAAQPLMVYVVAVFVVAPLFVFRSDLWRDFSRIQKILLAVAVVLSPPMLFSIERGNLIVFTLGLLALAIAREGWPRFIALGLLINIKPYFAIYLIALAFTKRTKEAIASALLAGAIFSITGILLDVDFLSFVPNLLQFSQNEAVFSARELLGLPSSLSAFPKVLQTYINQGGSTSFAGIDAGVIMISVETVKWLGIASAFTALLLGGRRVPTDCMLAVATVIISTLGVWVGGYSFILYIALIPVVMRMTYWKLYVTALSIIMLPIDVVPLLSDDIGYQNVYLSASTIPISWELGLGAIARPVVNFGLLMLMAFEVTQRYVFPISFVRPIGKHRDGPRSVIGF